MKNSLSLGFFVILILASCKNNSTDAIDIPKTEPPNEIHLYTADSIKVYGDLYKTDASAPTLLVFHQGGSNTRAEYKSIIPVLEQNGFNILTIDQRVGGQYYYGGYNRTVAEIPNNQYHYCDAYPDMEAALAYAKDQDLDRKLILWGSSYSATLALKLASAHPDDISGVLAFSPASGPPMKDCQPDAYIQSLKVPLLLMKPASEMQSERSQHQIRLATENGHDTYIAENGVHGSSMLDEDRIQGSAAETWTIVHTFLEQFK